MDCFTKEFCDMTFKRYPEWEKNSVAVKYKNSDAYYVSIEIQAPEPSCEKMQIITVDDEVTVEFSFYHVHYSDIQSALDFVEALQTEAIVVVKMNGVHGEKCSYLSTEEYLKTNQSAYKAVKSWKGTYDRSDS